MKRLGNVFDKICSIENLELALKKAAKRKKRRDVINRTFARKDVALPELAELMLKGKFKTSYYHKKVLYEPKRRTIYSLPFFPDRIVHHAVMNVLEPYLDARIVYDSYSSRKGKGLHKGSRRCMTFVRRYKYCLQCDISKFYQSVDHEVLRTVLRRKIKDNRLLALLDEVIDSANRIPNAVLGKNVPIGNLLSQWFGNVYMGEFDTWVKQELRFGPFLRYCDDFLFFSDSKDELNEIRKLSCDWLGERLKLTLSKANLFRTAQGVDFLGFRHFPDHILLRKRNVRKIKRFARKFYAGAFEKDMEHARGVASSYHGLMIHAQTHNLRKSLGFNDILEKVGVST